MAIRHLLWACPLCGRHGGVRAGKPDDTCSDCGASFRREYGALIRARRSDGTDIVRTAADWIDRIHHLTESAVPEPPKPARVVMREAFAKRPVRGSDGRLTGWTEDFGPARPGLLSLDPDTLAFRATDGHAIVIPLDSVSALQASSSSLLVNRNRAPALSFKFQEASLRFWQRAIEAALRTRYRAQGRGAIVEFQPRITTA